MIRPRPARWFAILAARDDAALALEALARTGAVELEAATATTLPEAWAEVRPRLARFVEFSLRYRAYWPGDRLVASPFPETPARTLDRCLATVVAWADAAEPIIRGLQTAVAEAQELERWQRVFGALAQTTIDLARSAAAGPLVRMRLFVSPAAAPPTMPPQVLLHEFVQDGTCYALALGTPDDLATLAQQTVAAKGCACDVPTWLATDMSENLARCAEKLARVERQQRELHAALAALHEQHGLREALANAWRLTWVLDNVRALEAGDLLCWITGWTSDRDGVGLAHAIEACGARAIVHYPPPPPGARPPLLLSNPAWARPFEVFSRALGMPSRNEADPSALLAIAVPLMFGYMFGDVGQGLVIALGGFVLRRRFALARLFIVGGLAATVFGFVFGSVFSLHLLTPWWLSPLSDPLTVLWVPLVGGGVLMTVGLLLRAVEAHWRGDFAVWLATDAGLIAVYLGLLVCLLWRPGLVVAGIGAVVYVAGHVANERRLAVALPALGDLAERTLQILINTLSFARVGAFALAHAGLSSAIVALVAAADSMLVAALVLVVGNGVVIVLEGLVVSIQTTRLVLFEFFTRFLVAEGRVFRPLPPPPTPLQEIPT